MNTHRIGNTEYVLFSIERADMGGRWNKKETLEQLKQAGIKYSTKDAYSGYVGQYGLWIEAAKEREAEELLFG